VSEPAAPAARSCGECSLCCRVLRVDAIGKLGGEDCAHRSETRGCGIYAERPAVCRDYRCLWLSGGLRDDDRPDRLGAVIDLARPGAGPILLIREALPGAFDRSTRLQEIAAEFRGSVPVRITDTGNVLDSDRPYWVLLPHGEEQRVIGERVEVFRDGRRIAERRLPWLERQVRRVALRAQRRRLRRFASRARDFRGRTGVSP
jgi:hypothetical protein